MPTVPSQQETLPPVRSLQPKRAPLRLQSWTNAQPTQQRRLGTTASPRSSILVAFVAALFFALILGGPDEAQAQMVVNEVDYDQPGTDASEFVELLNTSQEDLDLGSYRIDLINGASGERYDSISLPPQQLPAGGYFTVCTDRTHVRNCDLEVGPSFNLIQNGSPDAVAIVLGAAVLDSLSYEGDTPGYTEGRGTDVEDDPLTPHLSLARFPDGSDSDRNHFDFFLTCSTPGEPNQISQQGCGPEGLELSATGTCPGRVTLRTEGGSGGGSGSLLASTTLGNGELEDGPCAGLQTGLASPITAATFVFDVAGVYQMERQAGGAQCGWLLQVLDLSTCELSDPVALPQ